MLLPFFSTYPSNELFFTSKCTEIPRILCKSVHWPALCAWPTNKNGMWPRRPLTSPTKRKGRQQSSPAIRQLTYRRCSARRRVLHSSLDKDTISHNARDSQQPLHNASPGDCILIGVLSERRPTLEFNAWSRMNAHSGVPRNLEWEGSRCHRR